MSEEIITSTETPPGIDDAAIAAAAETVSPPELPAEPEAAQHVPFIGDAPDLFTPAPPILIEGGAISAATVLKSGTSLPKEIDDLVSSSVRAMLFVATASERKMARVRKRVVAYLRYSTTSQRPESLARQEELLRIFAELNDLEIVAVFIDAAVTGTIRHRRGLDGALDFIMEGGADGLLVEDCDRLARRFTIIPAIYEQLVLAKKELWDRRHGIIDSELKAAIVAAMASTDYRKQRERLAIGRRKLVERGGVLNVSYAYDAVPGTPGARVINDERAEVVREIYRLFVHESKSYAQIARILSARGLRPLRGRRWHAYGIEQILETTTHKGLYVFGRREDGDESEPLFDTVIARVPHLAIVDVELWNAAEARRDAIARQSEEVRTRKVAAKRAYATVDYLSRKVRCSLCDLPMVQHRHETHQVHRVFVCENEVYVRNHPGIHTSELRAAVIDGVKSLVGAPEHEELLTQYWLEGKQAREAQLKGDVARLEALLANVNAEVAASWTPGWNAGYSEEFKAGRRVELEASHRALRTQVEAAMRELRGFRALEVRQRSIMEKLKSIAEVGVPAKGSAELGEAMAALGAILRRVLVSFDEERNMFDVTVELCPNGDSDAPDPLIITRRREVWRLQGGVSDAYLEMARGQLEAGRWSLSEEQFAELLGRSVALRRATNSSLATRKAFIEAVLCCIETGINPRRLGELGRPGVKLSFNLWSRFAERGGKQELRDWLASDAQYGHLLPPGDFLAPGNRVIYLLPL